MASMVFNKRSVLSRLGKVGRKMIANQEILRIDHGMCYLLSRLSHSGHYVLTLCWCPDDEEGDFFYDLDFYEIGYALIDPKKRGLMKFVASPEVFETERQLAPGVFTPFLRTRLDVRCNHELFYLIDGEVDYIEALNCEIDAPTDMDVDWKQPLLRWHKSIDQDELIQEQHSV